MSLCFRTAFFQKEQKLITDADYLAHLVAHFGGVRHPEDDTDDAINGPFFRHLDPFGSSIRYLSLRTAYDPLTYTSIVYELFWNCLANNVEHFKSTYKQLKRIHPSINFIQPAAVFATIKRHLTLLEYCFENGAILDDDMDSAIETPSLNSDGMCVWNYQLSIPLLEFLYQKDWKRMKTSPIALRKLARPRFSIETLQWFLDHGARFGIGFVESIRNQSAAKVKFLVEKLGVDIFKGSGVINWAAIAGQTDVVEVLLDAGICIIDTPPMIDIREPGPHSAFSEAVRNKRWDTAKLLLNRGTPMDEGYRLRAERQGGDMAALFDGYSSGKGARQMHICNPKICDPPGGKRRELGQSSAAAKSPSFSFLFGD